LVSIFFKVTDVSNALGRDETALFPAGRLRAELDRTELAKPSLGALQRDLWHQLKSTALL